MTHPEINLLWVSLFLNQNGTPINAHLPSHSLRVGDDVAGGAREIRFAVNYVCIMIERV